MNTIETTLIKIAAKTFNVDEATAAATDYFFDFEIWDSLKQLEFIKNVQADFGIEFDESAVFQFFTRQDIINAIENIKA
jgi:acyl carrier protein